VETPPGRRVLALTPLSPHDTLRERSQRRIECCFSLSFRVCCRRGSRAWAVKAWTTPEKHASSAGGQTARGNSSATLSMA
jgi:hypothetical protein